MCNFYLEANIFCLFFTGSVNIFAKSVNNEFTSAYKSRRKPVKSILLRKSLEEMIEEFVNCQN